MFIVDDCVVTYNLHYLLYIRKLGLSVTGILSLNMNIHIEHKIYEKGIKFCAVENWQYFVVY